jgi:hypothetical protein
VRLRVGFEGQGRQGLAQEVPERVRVLGRGQALKNGFGRSEDLAGGAFTARPGSTVHGAAAGAEEDR